MRQYNLTCLKRINKSFIIIVKKKNAAANKAKQIFLYSYSIKKYITWKHNE